MIKNFLYIFLIFACGLSAEDKEGSVHGLVVDKTNNEKVASALIVISNDDNIYSAETDLSGKFGIEKIKPGKYKLSVTRIGYSDYVENILIVPGEKKETVLNISQADLPIESINITAVKTEVTLRQTPSSLVTVNSEEIKSRNIFTFDQLLEKIQGVSINRTSGLNVSSLSIRGSSDVAGGGIGNRVLLLLDGRPSLTGDSKGALWSLIPVSVIERTEVVKGAFSSLYGSSAIGGVVNVITKKPTYKPFTSVNLSYGFYEKLPDSLRYTGRLLAYKGADILHSNSLGRFSYLVNFNYKGNDGYAQQTDFDFYGGLGKFTFDLFGNRDLELTAQYTKSDAGYPHYWRKDPGKPAEPYKVSENLLDDKIKKETVSFDLQYNAVPNSTSKYSTRFYYYKLHSVSEYNPINPVTFLFGNPGEVFTTFITSYNFGNISQVDFNFGDKNYFIAGTDVQWNVVKSAPADILYGNQQQYNLGVFAQDNWKIFSDIFSSTFAARLDYNKFIGGKETFQLSPKFSLLYSPDVNSKILDNISYRFLIGRAFRAPSIAELYFKRELFGNFEFIYNPDLKPEEMISFELGFRKQYENRFNFDFALYFNYYDNLIQYVNVGVNTVGPFQVRNIAVSQVRGFEASMNYAHYFNLAEKSLEYRFDIGYTYADARDLSKNRQDDFLPYKPKHLFNFGINLFYENFNFYTGGRYVSKVEEVLFYKYEEPESFFVLDAKLSKRFGNNLTIYAAVNNIFDVFYQELERIAAPNRNFNFGVSYEF
jgi:outer membrane receptor protein involved in Fe transport